MITTSWLETHTLLTSLPLRISPGTLSYWFSLLSSKGLIYSLSNTPCTFPLLILLPTVAPTKATLLEPHLQISLHLGSSLPSLPLLSSSKRWLPLSKWLCILSFWDISVRCRVLEIFYCYLVSCISWRLTCQLDCKFLGDRSRVLKRYCSVHSAYTDQTPKSPGRFVCAGFVWW